MLINLTEAIETAKKSGATENPGMSLTVHLRPSWLAPILNFLYRGKVIGVTIYYGEIENGKLRMEAKTEWYESTWSENGVKIKN